MVIRKLLIKSKNIVLVKDTIFCCFFFSISTMEKQKTMMGLILLLLLFALNVSAWIGEIRGRVVCDICGDSSLGREE